MTVRARKMSLKRKLTARFLLDYGPEKKIIQ